HDQVGATALIDQLGEAAQVRDHRPVAADCQRTAGWRTAATPVEYHEVVPTTLRRIADRPADEARASENHQSHQPSSPRRFDTERKKVRGACWATMDSARYRTLGMDRTVPRSQSRTP